MSSFFAQFPFGGSGVATYPTLASFPASAINGTLAIALDSHDLYEFYSGAWNVLVTPTTHNAITALTGDVTATGPDSVPATVAFVGGSTAAAVGTAAVAVAAATNANTASTLVKRDPSGNFSAGTISATAYNGGTSKFQVDSSGNIVKINNVATSFPASQGGASTFLKNDGSGALTWASATPPVVVPGTSDGSVSLNGLPVAATGANPGAGYLGNFQGPGYFGANGPDGTYTPTGTDWSFKRLDLTPGNWLVWGMAGFVGNQGFMNLTEFVIGISSDGTSANWYDNTAIGFTTFPPNYLFTSSAFRIPLPTTVLSLASPVTINLVGYANYSGSAALFFADSYSSLFALRLP